jgi:hypothetical protein
VREAIGERLPDDVGDDHVDHAARLAERAGAKRANDLIAVAELPLDDGAIVFCRSDKLADNARDTDG